MAYGLCFLSKAELGRASQSNPHLVRLLMEIDKDKVAIVFDKDLQITVDGTWPDLRESPKSPVVTAAARQLESCAPRRHACVISGENLVIPLAG